MQLPFTVEQFYDVFRVYNETVWPAQVALLSLGLLAVLLVAVPGRRSDVIISAVLAILWLWIGLAYQLAFFAAVNPMAYGFAALSIAGGLIFLWAGLVRRRMQFRFSPGIRGIAGVALIVFALAVYPAWSVLAGHAYPDLPTFGLPCPTTIFTIGMLAFAAPPYPRAPLVAPILWCLVGGQAAFLLDVPQDLGLVLAAGVGLMLLLRASPASATEPAAHSSKAPRGR